MHVLVVTDDAALALSLGEYLEGLGWEADYAPDGILGLRLASQHCFDAIALDLDLPRLDGLSVCRQLRAQGAATPVLMLSGRQTLDEKLKGFSAGADDCLARPFELAELAARLGALQRRGAGHCRTLRVADLEYDLDTLQVRRRGRELSMRPAARHLLELLMRASPRVVRRETLERALWGEAAPETDVLRVHMYMLRGALEAPGERRLLHTLRGIGYRLDAA